MNRSHACAVLSALVVVGLVVNGMPWCPVQALAAVTLTLDEEASLAEVQRMVKEAIRIYRVLSPLDVSVASWVGSGQLSEFANSSVAFTSSHIYLSAALLGSPDRDAVIAAVLASTLLPRLSQVESMAEYDRARQRRRMDANLKAVEVLTRVKEWPERTSLEAIYNWLRGQHRAFVKRGKPSAKGEVPPCDQIQDLLTRFPQYRDWAAGRECSPSSWPSAAETHPTPSAPGGQDISFDFRDAEVGNVLRTLAEFTGVNFVAGEGVRGKISVRVDNAPWQKALEEIARAARFSYVAEAHVVYIDTPERVAARRSLGSTQITPRQAAPEPSRLVSLDFKDIALANLLYILGQFAGYEVFVREGFAGSLTIKVRNLPLGEALDQVIRAAGLVYAREGNVIRLARPGDLDQGSAPRVGWVRLGKPGPSHDVAPPAPGPAAGRIHLTSGAVIEADTWWEEGAFLFYSRAGTTAGVPRSEVVRIEGKPGKR